MSISAAALAVPASGIREIVNLVIERGPGVLRLEVGEPDFRTPAHIVEAGIEEARRGPKYTQSAGVLALRTAIAGKLRRVNSLQYSEDQIVVSQGGVQGVSALFTSVLEPGDEVLLPDPAWPNYRMLVELHGAVPVVYPLQPSDKFIPDPERVAALLSPRTKLIVVNSPSNPTGMVIPRPVIEALVRLAQRARALLMSDEVYEELVFDGEPANAPAYDPDSVVGVYSFSKTYAMTGWRVGYVAAQAELAAVMAKVQEPLISCISAVSQAAALAALDGPQDCVREMRDAYRRRRDLVVGLLGDAGIPVPVPRGAFYLMLPLTRGVDSRRAALDLVEHGVAVAPGTAFGGVAADHFRLSLASSEAVLSEAVERIVEWYRATDGGASLS